MDFEEVFAGLLVVLLLLSAVLLSAFGATAILQEGPVSDIGYMSGARDLIVNCQAELPRNENCVLIAVPEIKEQTK